MQTPDPTCYKDIKTGMCLSQEHLKNGVVFRESHSTAACLFHNSCTVQPHRPSSHYQDKALGWPLCPDLSATRNQQAASGQGHPPCQEATESLEPRCCCSAARTALFAQAVPLLVVLGRAHSWEGNLSVCSGSAQKAAAARASWGSPCLGNQLMPCLVILAPG